MPMAYGAPAYAAAPMAYGAPAYAAAPPMGYAQPMYPPPVSALLCLVRAARRRELTRFAVGHRGLQSGKRTAAARHDGPAAAASLLKWREPSAWVRGWLGAWMCDRVVSGVWTHGVICN
jgi:hypothetical protein